MTNTKKYKASRNIILSSDFSEGIKKVLLCHYIWGLVKKRLLTFKTHLSVLIHLSLERTKQKAEPAGRLASGFHD